MKAERKVLLTVLVLLVVVAAGPVGGVAYAEFRAGRLDEAAAKLAQAQAMEARIAEAVAAEHAIEALARELEDRRGALYKPEMDVFTFGLVMNQLFREEAVIVKRYYTVDGTFPTLEFEIAGTPEGVVRFLKVVEELPKLVWIPVMILRAAVGSVEGTIQVSYAKVE